MDSFCKGCGRDVHDFQAPEDAWAAVEPLVKHGSVLCYDCFCDLCKRVDYPTVWRLETIHVKGRRDFFEHVPDAQLRDNINIYESWMTRSQRTDRLLAKIRLNKRALSERDEKRRQLIRSRRIHT